MNSLGRSRVPLALVLTAMTVFLVTELSNPRAASTEATACTLYTNTRPISGAECQSRLFSNCYICETTNDGGTRTCSEYPDGTSRHCRPGPFYPAPNP